MLKRVRVVNHLGDILDVEPRNPEKSGFLFYQITGIGSGKAILGSTDLATGDGSYPNHEKLEPRYISISALFYPMPDIESTRHLAYKFFPTKKTVTLIFTTEHRECFIRGRVESNEPSIFTSMEGSQISIKCDDPHFYSTESMSTKFFGIEGGFEFPFENESLDFGTLEFGQIAANRYQVITYSGDTEIGITIRVHAIGSATGVSVFNVQTKEQISIDSKKLVAITGSDISNGDEIEICTVERNKHIHLLRGGKRINILNAVGRKIDWLRLGHGDNIFTYDASSGIENLQFEISNQIIYEGV